VDVNDFDGGAMAHGYARYRPPVHPVVMEAARPFLGFRGTGLDIGCGAGLSTEALRIVARTCIGIDPLESMVRAAAGRALYAAAAAEALPFAAGTFDVISAAGSLNYAEPEGFFREAARVLKPDGRMVVYDFSPGRVGDWLDEFRRRYPPPTGSARPFDPETVRAAARGFRVIHAERFEYGLTLTPEFYLEYMLTETSVADAVRRGTPPESIRAWCAETLSFFTSPREVLFPGYFVVLERE
jgi:SAM-dependent methyltransferase